MTSPRSKKRVRAWAIINRNMDERGSYWIDAYTKHYSAEQYFADRKPAPEVIIVPCTIEYALPPKARLRRQARGKK